LGHPGGLAITNLNEELERSLERIEQKASQVECWIVIFKLEVVAHSVRIYSSLLL
jgi:hypothetical protein